MRFIQAAISDEDHYISTVFAAQHQLTLSELIEIAVRDYINLKRKEEEIKENVERR